MVPSYLTSWKPVVILSDSEKIQETFEGEKTTWINEGKVATCNGGLCYVGKGQRSLMRVSVKIAA